VAGVVIITGLVGYRYFKHHYPSLSNHGLNAAAAAAQKKL
jgi:hypothetical protein